MTSYIVRELLTGLHADEFKEKVKELISAANRVESTSEYIQVRGEIIDLCEMRYRNLHITEDELQLYLKMLPEKSMPRVSSSDASVIVQFEHEKSYPEPINNDYLATTPVMRLMSARDIAKKFLDESSLKAIVNSRLKIAIYQYQFAKKNSSPEYAYKVGERYLFDLMDHPNIDANVYAKIENSYKELTKDDYE